MKADSYQNILSRNKEYSFHEKAKITILLISLSVYTIGIPIISFITLFTGFFLSLFFNEYKKIKFYQIFSFFLLFSFILTYYSITNYYLYKLKIDSRMFSLFQLFWLIFNPLCLYYFSQIIPLKSKKNLIKFLVILFSFQVMYNVFLVAYSIMKLGLLTVIIGRNIINIFTGEHILATYSGITLLLGFALFSTIFTKVKNNYKIISLFVVTISLVTSMIIQTRTPVFFGLLVIFIVLITNFLYSSPKRKLKMVSFYSSMFLISSIFVTINIDRIIHYLSIFFYRIFQDGLSSPRYDSWREGLKGLIDNPLGGMNQQYFFGFAHNLWLDIGSYTGVLPIIILLIFQFYNSIGLIRIFKYDSEIFLVLFSILMCYLFAFMVEPIMIASPMYFAFSVFIMGLIKNYSNYISRDKSND